MKYLNCIDLWGHRYLCISMRCPRLCLSLVGHKVWEAICIQKNYNRGKKYIYVLMGYTCMNGCSCYTELSLVIYLMEYLSLRCVMYISYETRGEIKFILHVNTWVYPDFGWYPHPHDHTKWYVIHISYKTRGVWKSSLVCGAWFIDYSVISFICVG